MIKIRDLLFPNGEKFHITLIICGMIFLTLTGFNARFIPCNSELNYCSLNYLNAGESYNNNSYFSVLLIFGVLPYLLSCAIVEWFK